ncbi:carboxymuconolactone decarboxylase family protein [Chromobacterium alticapitis]|uniref:Carboxymuconolactone decarboxylase family protein n=1 Tax=Chromobacterium alticapitis TaxID=2073169 RepID=A0A2S5DIV2_9NEIS|nr:carboxymuconolactone decarboxylase family protein [Chromobacterium alticapitis]POZ63003.1 carboxymuconolactone decarboxylase family protein [Chromobacterium alticapitis]
MIRQDAQYQKGLELIEFLHGGHTGGERVAAVAEISPDFADMSIAWATGHILSRPGLDLATRELILVASCATQGFAQVQLLAHAEAALRAGATRRQILETILQLTFYAGGPAVSNALLTLKDVLAEPLIEPACENFSA